MMPTTVTVHLPGRDPAAHHVLQVPGWTGRIHSVPLSAAGLEDFARAVPDDPPGVLILLYEALGQPAPSVALGVAESAAAGLRERLAGDCP